MMRLPRSTTIWKVVSAVPYSQPEAFLDSAQQLTDSGRYFDGTRRIRFLSVLVSVEGEPPSYAGATPAERELWVSNQRRLMSEQYEFGTYSKLGFDHGRSTVEHVSLQLKDTELDDLLGGCETVAYELTKAASAKIQAAQQSNIDAVLYYLPPAATHTCATIQGLCYPGQLATVNKDSEWPPYVNVDRTNWKWHAGCWVRGTTLGGSLRDSAKAQIDAHEIGHYLGLRHAAGPGEYRDGMITPYGDISAVMGSDNVFTNSFTAPARFHLGVLHPASVKQTTGGLTTLRSLSLGADPANANHYLAIALPCPGCKPRCSSMLGGCVPHPPKNGIGGELWIAYRGDDETCAPEHLSSSGSVNSTFRCHGDHPMKHNKLTVHYRQSGRYVLAEKWYWLGLGEVYEPPGSGFVITMCRPHTNDTSRDARSRSSIDDFSLVDKSADDDYATVAIGTTAEAAIAQCDGFFPPPSPPAPPAQPLMVDTSCEDLPGQIDGIIFSGEQLSCAELPSRLTAVQLSSACAEQSAPRQLSEQDRPYRRSWVM